MKYGSPTQYDIDPFHNNCIIAVSFSQVQQSPLQSHLDANLHQLQIGETGVSLDLHQLQIGDLETGVSLSLLQLQIRDVETGVSLSLLQLQIGDIGTGVSLNPQKF